MGRAARHGSVMLSALMYSVITLLIGALLITMVMHKYRNQVGLRKVDKKEALLKAIMSRTVNDLKVNLSTTQNCSLDLLMAKESKSFKSDHPQYGKGDFTLDEYGKDMVPTGRFFAPESDPVVYLESQSSPGIYKLVIETSVCTVEVANRVRFVRKDPEDNSPLGLGLPWNVTCPSANVEKINYTGFFDTSSLISYYSVYMDRSTFGNTAFEEPTLDSAEDSQEKNAGGDITATLIGTGLVRYTGATHDKGTSCAPRTKSAIAAAIAAIAKRDSCSYLSLNVAAGKDNGNKIIHYGAKWPGRRLKDFGAQISSDLETICKTFRPAGSTSAQDILNHYVANEQTVPAGDLPAGAENRKHQLFVISDGWSFLGTLENPSGNTSRLRRANVYFSGNQCQGTAVVESYLGYAQSTSFTGTLIYAGDALYSPTGGALPASAPLPVADPPLDPLPNGAFLVRSVHNSLDGECVDILSPTDQSQLAFQYNYYLRRPVMVESVSGSASGTLQAYQPLTTVIDAFNAKVKDPVTGLRSYPNGFALFPLPATDLDETSISSYGYSSLPYVSNGMQSDFLPAYLAFFRWVDSPKPNERGFGEGITMINFTDQ